MPNWNENTLTVKGKPEEVIMFIKENFMTRENPHPVRKGQYDYILDFEKLHPTPKKTNGDIIDEWYEWRNENWGCKWSPVYEQCNSLTFTLNRDNECNIIKTYYNVDSKENIFDERMITRYSIMYETHDNNELYDEAELSSFFETPWGPPGGMIHYWSNRYKDTSLEIRCGYYESAMCVAGEYRVNDKDDDERLSNEHYSYISDSIEYKKYILDEGWENVGYMTERTLELLEYINPDMDENMLQLLATKVKETIDNAENTKQIATLIDDIERRWREAVNSNKKRLA